MKRGWLVMMMILSGVCVMRAQMPAKLTYTVNKEGKIMALPKYKTYELAFPAYSYKPYAASHEMDVEMKGREFTPGFQLSLNESPMDIQVLSTAYRPFFDIYAPMMRAVSPMAFDFRETSIVPINDNITFFTAGSQYTWPGVGGMTMINPGMIWRQANWTISGGGFAGRFYTPFNLHPGYMAGANLQVRYDVNKRIALRTWGQYAFYGKKENYNPYMLANPFYNHTSVGGAAEFMINDNFGIGGGVNYEYNPYKRRMEPQYMLYPVIRNVGIKIGAW
ncbi:MAG: hypothetical protein LBF62_02115 [Tannerellaceae bacterium]|jgi:hypothetical protein|nr:hypothetical protein [Tannerellaceae bacterium]